MRRPSTLRQDADVTRPIQCRETTVRRRATSRPSMSSWPWCGGLRLTAARPGGLASTTHACVADQWLGVWPTIQQPEAMDQPGSLIALNAIPPLMSRARTTGPLRRGAAAYGFLQHCADTIAAPVTVPSAFRLSVRLQLSSCVCGRSISCSKPQPRTPLSSTNATSRSARTLSAMSFSEPSSGTCQCSVP